VQGLTREQLGFLGGLRALRALTVSGTPRDGWEALRPHSGVHELSVTSERDDWLADLAGWTSLRSLYADIAGRDVPEILHAVSGSPGIESLSLALRSLTELVPAAPLPRIRNLELHGLIEYGHVFQLRRVFPGLRTLFLSFDALSGVPLPLNLSELGELPGLAVTLAGPALDGVRIVGADALGPRLTLATVARPVPRGM
jgi:hypothetical protein